MAQDTTSTTDREKLLSRLRKLRQMTPENGASESESAFAAAKLADLMQEHGIRYDELGLRSAGRECTSDSYTNFSARRQDWFNCASPISVLFGTRAYSHTNREDLLGLGFEQTTCEVVFFGLPEDVAASVAMMQIAATAVEFESAAYEKREGKRARSFGRLESFRAGLISRLCDRISELRGNMLGTGLVVLKSQLVDDAFAASGVKLRSRAVTRPTYNQEAYAKGHATGSNVELNRRGGAVSGQRQIGSR